MDQDRSKRKLTAIFSADVVGYSRLMEADEAWTIQNLEENKKLISKLIEEYEGRVIDAPGDNLLAEFSSVINAVECAVKIQHELKKKNDHLIESNRMHFRIGINLGDVVEEDGRIYGNGVNIAARLEGLTDPGGICISRRTYDHVKTRLDLGYEYLGEHNVKNISEPVRVYRVLMGSENAGKVIGEKKASRLVSRRLAMTTIIALIIIAAGSLIWMYSHQSRKIEQASEPEQAPAVVNVAEATKTIAVLPFENLSSDLEQEYFVDGLSEELLNCLANINGLRVTSRTSSFAFKNTDKTLQEVAGVLGVEHILEGSVRKAGEKLRITAQLIRVKDDSHLWSNIYDRELKDIFTIQENIATAVANELKVALGIDTAIRQLGGTDNLEAYELYLLSKGQIADARSGGTQALGSIDAAIELDPEFAPAWALKATIHSEISVHGSPDSAASERDAGLRAARRAVELEPDLVDGYISMGFVQTCRGELIEAESVFRRVFELTTQSFSDDGMTYAAMHYIATGNFKKAHEILTMMRRADPLNEGFRMFYIYTSVLIGDRKGAEAEYERGKSLFGAPWLNGFMVKLGSGIAFEGKLPFDPSKIASDTWARQLFGLIEEYIKSPEEGLKVLRRIYSEDENIGSPELDGISICAAGFGDPEFAMSIIERMVTIDPAALFHIWSPVFHKVRQLPQFKELVREIGLVDYWEQFGWPDICQPTGDGDFECD